MKIGVYTTIRFYEIIRDNKNEINALRVASESEFHYFK